MTNQIEPYSMIQKTNIKEHNDMVNKINEIVDVINNVNLDTINAEISGLKAKATATDTEIANIKDKDSMQDTEIDGIDKSLISDVTATFDNPSRELKISVGKKDSTSIDATVVIPSSSETGQYSAGNGISIENYQIAVDTNVVALKTDIPDVSGINNRLDTIDGEITGINANITNLTNKNTEQDTAINGKVAIAQGVENSGKVLGIGADGNVTPVNAGGGSGGGEVWEEVDLSNWPTDWQEGDIIRINAKKFASTISTSSWSVAPTPGSDITLHSSRSIVYIRLITGNNSSIGAIVDHTVLTNYIIETILNITASVEAFNSTTGNIGNLLYRIYNGGGCSFAKTTTLNKTSLTTAIDKMWRCRAST